MWTDLYQVSDTSWPEVFLQSQPLEGLCLAGFSGGWGAIFASDKWKSTHRLGNYTTLRSWHVDSLGRYARLNLVRDERIYFSFIWLDFYYPFHYFPISFPDLLVFSALLSSSVHFWRQIQLYAEGFYFPIFVHDQMYQTLWQSSRTKPRSSHNTQRATGLHRCWVLFLHNVFLKQKQSILS